MALDTPTVLLRKLCVFPPLISVFLLTTIIYEKEILFLPTLNACSTDPAFFALG